MNEFKSWNSYRNFASRVRRKTRYIRTPEDDEFLREVLRTSKSRIRGVPDNAELWRAQLSHDWEPRYEGDRHVGDLPVAYLPERMKPLPGRATVRTCQPEGNIGPLPTYPLAERPPCPRFGHGSAHWSHLPNSESCER